MVRRGPAYDSNGEEIDPSDIEYDERLQGGGLACGEECTAVTVDFGIGPYECWGARGNDVQLEEVSPCCEDEVVTKERYENEVAGNDDMEK